MTLSMFMGQPESRIPFRIHVWWVMVNTVSEELQTQNYLQIYFSPLPLCMTQP